MVGVRVGSMNLVSVYADSMYPNMGPVIRMHWTIAKKSPLYCQDYNKLRIVLENVKKKNGFLFFFAMSLTNTGIQHILHERKLITGRLWILSISVFRPSTRQIKHSYAIVLIDILLN